MEFHAVAGKSDVGRLRKLIRGELGHAGWPEGSAFDCLVAVSEACVNAILHGTEAGDSHPGLAWSIEPTRAEFVIRNHSSRGWSRRAHPSNLGKERAPDERSGGWGLELMRLLMDDVSIDIRPDGTEVRLLKRLG